MHVAGTHPHEFHQIPVRYLMLRPSLYHFPELGFGFVEAGLFEQGAPQDERHIGVLPAAGDTSYDGFGLTCLAVV